MNTEDIIIKKNYKKQRNGSHTYDDYLKIRV